MARARGPAAVVKQPSHADAWVPPPGTAASLRRGAMAAFAAAGLAAVTRFTPDEAAHSILPEFDVRILASLVAVIPVGIVIAAYTGLAESLRYRALRIFAILSFALPWALLAGRTVSELVPDLRPLALVAHALVAYQSFRWALAWPSSEPDPEAGSGTGKKAAKGCSSAFSGVVVMGVLFKLFGRAFHRGSNATTLRDVDEIVVAAIAAATVLAIAGLAVAKFAGARRLGGTVNLSAVADLAYAGLAAALVLPLIRAALPATDIEDLLHTSPDSTLADAAGLALVAMHAACGVWMLSLASSDAGGPRITGPTSGPTAPPAAGPSRPRLIYS